MASVFDRYGLQKLSELDVNKLQALMPGVELGEDANTLKFKTPGGHSVTTPYARDVVEHQFKRLGGSEPYHAALAKRLQDEGVGVDTSVERGRNLDVSSRRFGKSLGLGTVGAGAGMLLGSLAKNKTLGKAIGGTLGTVGGALLGYSLPTERKSGPTSQHIDEISELYKEPEHVKQLKSQLSDLQGDVDSLRHRRRYGYGNYDPYGHRRYDPLYDPLYDRYGFAY
jgi:hypothetical protein